MENKTHSKFESLLNLQFVKSGTELELPSLEMLGTALPLILSCSITATPLIEMNKAVRSLLPLKFTQKQV